MKFEVLILLVFLQVFFQFFLMRIIFFFVFFQFFCFRIGSIFLLIFLEGEWVIMRSGFFVVVSVFLGILRCLLIIFYVIGDGSVRCQCLLLYLFLRSFVLRFMWDSFLRMYLVVLIRFFDFCILWKCEILVIQFRMLFELNLVLFCRKCFIGFYQGIN